MDCFGMQAVNLHAQMLYFRCNLKAILCITRISLSLKIYSISWLGFKQAMFELLSPVEFSDRDFRTASFLIYIPVNQSL